MDPAQLRAKRHMFHLTRDELAARLHVDAGDIGRWERGEEPLPSALSMQLQVLEFALEEEREKRTEQERQRLRWYRDREWEKED